MARPNSQRSSDEFSDDGAKRNVAIRDVKSRFRLIEAATCRAAKNSENQGRDQEPSERWREKGSPCGRCERTTEKIKMDPFHGDPEADHGKSGENAYEDGKNEKKTILVEGKLSGEAASESSPGRVDRGARPRDWRGS